MQKGSYAALACPSGFLASKVSGHETEMCTFCAQIHSRHQKVWTFHAQIYSGCQSKFLETPYYIVHYYIDF